MTQKIPNKNLLRLTGLSAILGAVTTFVIFEFTKSWRTDSIFSMCGTAAFIAQPFFYTVVFWTLYVLHREQSADGSMAMLACSLAALLFHIVGWVFPWVQPYTIAATLTSIAFLLLGFLSYKNDQMPRWLAALAFAVGIFSLGVITANAAQNTLLQNILANSNQGLRVAWLLGVWFWCLQQNMLSNLSEIRHKKMEPSQDTTKKIDHHCSDVSKPQGRFLEKFSFIISILAWLVTLLIAGYTASTWHDQGGRHGRFDLAIIWIFGGIIVSILFCIGFVGGMYVQYNHPTRISKASIFLTAIPMALLVLILFLRFLG